MARDGRRQGCAADRGQGANDEDGVRAAIGALFFVLSLIYVVGTIKRALGNAA